MLNWLNKFSGMPKSTSSSSVSWKKDWLLGDMLFWFGVENVESSPCDNFVCCCCLFGVSKSANWFWKDFEFFNNEFWFDLAILFESFVLAGVVGTLASFVTSGEDGDDQSTNLKTFETLDLIKFVNWETSSFLSLFWLTSGPFFK